MFSSLIAAFVAVAAFATTTPAQPAQSVVCEYQHEWVLVRTSIEDGVTLVPGERAPWTIQWGEFFLLCDGVPIDSKEEMLAKWEEWATIPPMPEADAKQPVTGAEMPQKRHEQVGQPPAPAVEPHP